MSNQHKNFNMQQLFTWLMEDGIIKKDDAKVAFNHARGLQKNGPADMHPLTAIAQSKLYSAIKPQQLLTLDFLTEWAAKKAGVPFYRIDPLKIDFTKVADIMSSTYATRFNILPVDATSDTVIVATTNPFDNEWLDEIGRITQKEIQLVLANPLEFLFAQYTAQSGGRASILGHTTRCRGASGAGTQNLSRFAASP